MKNITACIFDLDGVIVDTAKYHYLAWKRLANEIGIDFTEEDNERLKGVSRMRSLDIILEIGGKTLEESEKLTLAEKKNAWYVESISKLAPDEILPGVIDFLTDLRKNNIKISLGSASKNSMLILEKLDLIQYFDAIIDGTKVSKAKPDPEVFLQGAAALNVDPKNCIVFEDAEAGVEAAVAAGMHCIGIGEESILSKANFVIKGMHEMKIDRFNEL